MCITCPKVFYTTCLFWLDPPRQDGCLPPCVNGECIDNDTCVCSPGYTGEICDMAIISECDTNPCENGGNCSIVATSQVCIVLRDSKDDYVKFQVCNFLGYQSV